MVIYYTASRTPTSGQYTSDCELKKGFPYTYKPNIRVLYQTNRGFGVFVGIGSQAPCTCAIDCLDESDVVITPPAPEVGDPPSSNYVTLPVSTVCPAVEELVFAARVNNASTTSPTDFLLTFTDVFGNIKELTISILRWVVPKVPTVDLTSYSDPPTQFGSPLKTDYHSVDVTVPFTSSDDTDIKSSVQAYQVQRYTGHEANLYLVRGWSNLDLGSNPDNKAKDFLVLPGITYGYRVRYRGNDGDITAWSPWGTITT